MPTSTQRWTRAHHRSAPGDARCAAAARHFPVVDLGPRLPPWEIYSSASKKEKADQSDGIRLDYVLIAERPRESGGLQARQSGGIANPVQSVVAGFCIC
jgi:hypothetical protein